MTSRVIRETFIGNPWPADSWYGMFSDEEKSGKFEIIKLVAFSLVKVSGGEEVVGLYNDDEGYTKVAERHPRFLKHLYLQSGTLTKDDIYLLEQYTKLRLGMIDLETFRGEY